VATFPFPPSGGEPLIHQGRGGRGSGQGQIYGVNSR
jgi:hypothetical protein